MSNKIEDKGVKIGRIDDNRQKSSVFTQKGEEKTSRFS